MDAVNACGRPSRRPVAVARGTSPWIAAACLLGGLLSGPPIAAHGDELRIRIGDRDRRVIVTVPAGTGARRPAVLVLHGGMGSAAGMRAASGFDPLAHAEGFIAAYPEGTAYGEDRHAWNTGFLLRRQVRDADDVTFLDAVIDTLIRDHRADPERIFMTGGSNGGMMTFVYAVQRAERLAAIAPVVATMFSFDVMPRVPLPILIINGGLDEEVPFEGGMSRNPLVRAAQASPFKPVRDVVDFWAQANASVPEAVTVVDGTVTTETRAAGPGGAVTEFVIDSAGGHGWPGSPPRRAGAAPIASFRGAERVWRFLREHARTPATAR